LSLTHNFFFPCCIPKILITFSRYNLGCFNCSLCLQFLFSKLYSLFVSVSLFLFYSACVLSLLVSLYLCFFSLFTSVSVFVSASLSVSASVFVFVSASLYLTISVSSFYLTSLCFPLFVSFHLHSPSPLSVTPLYFLSLTPFSLSLLYLLTLSPLFIAYLSFFSHSPSHCHRALYVFIKRGVVRVCSLMDYVVENRQAFLLK
jgi:hypothetical protein